MTLPTDDIVQSLVSHPTSRVFTVRGLPEEVIAVLFAYYSRSAKGLRDALRDAIASGDIPAEAIAPIRAATTAKASAFHEKWVVGYSHASVAEHAVVHVAIEPCSILAAKAIEDCRYAAYTEQSTRFVPYDRTSYLDPESVGVPFPQAQAYRDACTGLLDAYGDVSDALTAKAAELYPDATPSGRRGWVLDHARSLLPVATPTRLGMTLNGRGAAHMIRKLKASEHVELQQLGVELAEHIGRELPTLVKYTDAESGRASLRERFRAASLYEPATSTPVRSTHISVLVNDQGYDTEALRQAMIRDAAGDAHASSRMTYESVCALYLGERGAHERHGRALEAQSLDMHIRCDYGAWRDIQRHRTTSAAPVRINPRSRVCLPDKAYLPDAVYERAERAVQRAQAVAIELESLGSPSAQYPQPLGTMIDARLFLNLRALAQFIELRSGVEGHDRYRTVAHRAHDYLTAVDPTLAQYIRCDRRERTLARK